MQGIVAFGSHPALSNRSSNRLSHFPLTRILSLTREAANVSKSRVYAAVGVVGVAGGVGVFVGAMVGRGVCVFVGVGVAVGWLIFVGIVEGVGVAVVVRRGLGVGELVDFGVDVSGGRAVGGITGISRIGGAVGSSEGFLPTAVISARYNHSRFPDVTLRSS